MPFVFSSNGHQFVEYDRFTGQTSSPRPLADIPTPADLRTRYEQSMGFGKTRGHYNAGSFESRLLLPERVETMAAHLFEQLVLTGGPEQKTIVFCASDQHADNVAIALNNLYAD